MPSSSNSTTGDDKCEHCHSAYSLIKRKVKISLLNNHNRFALLFFRKLVLFVVNLIVQIVPHMNLIIPIVYVLFAN